MARKAAADAVAIKSGTYHIHAKNGTATVHVASDHSAREIAQAFSALTEGAACHGA